MIHRFSDDWRNHPSVEMETFARDVTLGIMPIGGQSDRVPHYAVEIQGSSDEHKTRAIAMLKSDVYNRHDDTRSLAKLLSDKVEIIARGLVWTGRVFFKIVRNSENRAVRLFSGFTSGVLFHAFGWYLQIMPRAQRSPGERPYVLIPEKDIWNISMPEALGSYRGHRSLLRNLGKSQILPPFLSCDLNQQNLPAYFDPQHYRRERDFFHAKITALWGWHQPSDGGGNWTDFYSRYRWITLKWAQACLREHIVEELNQLFQRLHIEAKIVVKGLPTPQKVLEIRQQMCEGKMSFSDATDACSV